MKNICILLIVLLMNSLFIGCGSSSKVDKPIPSKWIPPPPISTGFDASDPRRLIGGKSELTVDNSRNDYDVMVKLYNIESSPTVARVFNIRAGGTFVVREIVPGNYDLRFRNLKTGNIQKTEPIFFEEKRTSTGIQYSTVSFTLYTVKSGNAKMTAIDEAQF